MHSEAREFKGHSQQGYDEEGFSDDDKEPEFIIRNNKESYVSTNLSELKKAKPRYREPKTKLKFVLNVSSTRNNISNSISDREHQNRSHNAKSLEFRKRDLKSNSVLPAMHPITKTKRTLIGENLTIPHYAIQDLRALKTAVMSEGHTISFEAPSQNNTHGFFRRFMMDKKKEEKKDDSRSFLENRMNYLLRERLRDSFIMPKKSESQLRNQSAKIEFNSSLESGNLEIAASTGENEFDLYLRIDTNTHGHQNWFYFQAKCNHPHPEPYTLNICNMKREFRLIQRGQKIFVKEVDPQGNSKGWKTAGDKISIKENTNPKIARGRIYKLSFELLFKPDHRYFIAMLPPYTYTQILDFVDTIGKKHPNLVEVEMLSYSLTGLAIPIVTITDKEEKSEDKKVVLVSCRIHPGETVASYVGEGFMRKLLDQSNNSMVDLVRGTIFKIIPIINPDGVVFGNFRTNYLGIDLNRAFFSDDEILNPEIYSLKSIGRDLKNQYGNRFLYFIDLHGHSSQKNVFSYGPAYEFNDPQSYVSRILPKVLNIKSKYFKYQDCTFSLEEHKRHTARGYFLSELNVMTYTIESSYSLYENGEGAEKNMEVEDWIEFGKDLAECFETVFKLREMGKIRTNRELKKILSEKEQEQVTLMKKIKQDLKKESKTAPKAEIDLESDAESEEQDLNDEERKDIDKKILQNCLPSFSLPRVLKPAILYPTVTPKLFQVNQEKDEGSMKILYTKRSKYNTLRMVNANSMYANYLKNLDELERFKPSARNIKLEKKIDL